MVFLGATMTDDIIEAAARALYKQHAVKGGDHCWDDFVPDAEAVLAAVTPMIEARTLEQAAQTFDDYYSTGHNREEIAAAIRALKEQT
jgi:hypothetical protein